MVSTVNLPMIMNIFHNEEFIFDTAAPFKDRIGKDEYYTGEGDLLLVRQGSHMWETNFVPDLEHLELQSYEVRAAPLASNDQSGSSSPTKARCMRISRRCRPGTCIRRRIATAPARM